MTKEDIESKTETTSLPPKKQKKAAHFTEIGELEMKWKVPRNLVCKIGKPYPWFRFHRREEKLKNPLLFRYALQTNDIEVEAFAGDLYRLIIGLHQPKLRATDDGSMVSKAVQGFVPLEQCNLMSPDEALRRGLVPVMVASYFLEETDLHLKNVGLDENGQMVRIDFDNSLCAVSRTRKLLPISGILDLPNFVGGVSPVIMWKNWRPCLDQLKSDEHFIKEIFQYCLKIMVLDFRTFDVMAADHLSQANHGSNQHTENIEVLAHLKTRAQQLKAFLIEEPQFKVFFDKYHKGYWSSIRRDLLEYNSEILSSITKVDKYLQALKKGSPEPGLLKAKYKDLSVEAMTAKLLQEKSDHQSRLIDMDAVYRQFVEISLTLQTELVFSPSKI